MNIPTKYPIVVYWVNSKNHKKWQCCINEEKAIKLRSLLYCQKVLIVWIAKDLNI